MWVDYVVGDYRLVGPLVVVCGAVDEYVLFVWVVGVLGDEEFHRVRVLDEVVCCEHDLVHQFEVVNAY